MSDGYEHALESAEGRRTALYSVLGQVPAGKVVSYGQLAELAGLGGRHAGSGVPSGNCPRTLACPGTGCLAQAAG